MRLDDTTPRRIARGKGPARSKPTAGSQETGLSP